MDIIGDRPVVSRGLAAKSVTEMIFSAPRCKDTLGRRDVPGANLFPNVTEGLTGTLIVDKVDLLRGVGTIETGPLVHDVLRLLLEKVTAAIHVISEDGNVLPWGGMPVRVVITLLRAFKSVTIAIRILAGELSGVALKFL